MTSEDHDESDAPQEDRPDEQYEDPNAQYAEEEYYDEYGDPVYHELTKDEKTMGMLVHLLGLFASLWGPLIFYIIKKDERGFARDQAIEALNWQLSMLIYLLISFALTFVLIGIIGFIALTVMDIVFCILAAIRANEGRYYRYPMTIRFL